MSLPEPSFYLVRLGVPSRGDTIHKSTCRYAQKPNALRWAWADKYPTSDWAYDAPWLHRCQVRRRRSTRRRHPMSLSDRGIVVTDGAGDRYEVVGYDATFTLRPLDREGNVFRIDSATLRELGIEWDGRVLKEAPGV